MNDIALRERAWCGDRVRTAYIPCTELCCGTKQIGHVDRDDEMSQVEMTQEPSGVTGAVVTLIYDPLTSLRHQNDLIVNTWSHGIMFTTLYLFVS